MEAQWCTRMCQTASEGLHRFTVNSLNLDTGRKQKEENQALFIIF